MKAIIVFNANLINIVYVESFDGLSKVGVRQWCDEHGINYNEDTYIECYERLDDVNITHFVV